MYNEFEHKTENNTFIIKSYTDYIEVSEVESDYLFTRKLCEAGCANFGKKYSCPPRSTDFEHFREEYTHIVINAFVIPYENLDKKTFNIVKAANVICKSKQRKIFNKVESEISNTKYKMLENGSCRLCKQCALQRQEPCKYPNKMRYSMEATGVRVDKLVKKMFGINLNWYHKGQKDNFPEFQCVVSGILTSNPSIVQNHLISVLNQKVN
jgi:predicted metal-binding protein